MVKNTWILAVDLERLKILAEKYPHLQVYGMDSDRERIEMGKQRYRLPNLHLLHTREIVGRYSSCTAFFVLREIADARKTLIDLYEHLNDDGRIMVDDFMKTSRAKYREWYEKGKRSHSFEEEYRKHNRCGPLDSLSGYARMRVLRPRKYNSAEIIGSLTSVEDKAPKPFLLSNRKLCRIH
jgi:trans-aconitate methyltransferase